MFLVYKLTRQDNKIYIGIARESRFRFRLYSHKSSKRFKGQQFSNEILKNNLSYEEARKFEEYFISVFDSYNNGLNETKDGSGNHQCPQFTTYGYKFSEESKKKMSESAKKAIKEGRKRLWNKGVKNCFSREVNEVKSKRMIGKQLYTKLTKEQINEIRWLYETKSCYIHNEGIVQRNGVPMSYLQAFSKKVAPLYNVTPQCIKKIVLKETWNNV